VQFFNHHLSKTKYTNMTIFNFQFFILWAIKNLSKHHFVLELFQNFKFHFLAKFASKKKAAISNQ